MQEPTKPEYYQYSAFDDETPSFRRDAGLPKVERKTRECLRCDNVFVSEGIGNRMCSPCKISVNKQGMD